MSSTTLIVGIVLGAILLGGVLFITGEDVNADGVCSDTLDGNWTGERVNTNLQNQSMTIQCTNGDRVENLSVGINVEVDG